MPVNNVGAYRGTSGAAGPVDTILKEFYLGPVREQLNSETLLMKRLGRNEENVEGREVVIPLHTGRTPGILAVLEGGDLPAAGSQGYTDMRFRVPYNYGRIRLSGPAMASARTRRGAFIRVLDQEIRGLVRDFKYDLNRQMWGDGSGRCATITNVASTTFTVKGVWDFAGQDTRLKHIHAGDRVAFEDVSAADTIDDFNNSGFIAVDSVNIANQTFTIAATAGNAAAADHVIKGNGAGVTLNLEDTSFRGTVSTAVQEKKEMMGLVGICSGAGTSTTNWACNSGRAAYTAVGAGQVYVDAGAGGGGSEVLSDVQGVNAATEGTWLSNNFFNAGVARPLTTDLMQQAFDACEEIGQSTPSIGITSYGVRRKYVDLLVSDRRYVNEYVLDGGFKAIDFNGVPIVPEKDCPEGSMFFLSEDYLSLYRMSDFYWLDKDGSILSRVDGKDAWEAVMAYYAELATDRRNTHAVIGDVAI